MGDHRTTATVRAAQAQGRIARRRGKKKDTSERLGRHRWVVERTTLAWLARCRRRLSVRYERRADIHEAFLYLGCSLICLNYLS